MVASIFEDMHGQRVDALVVLADLTIYRGHGFGGLAALFVAAPLFVLRVRDRNGRVLEETRPAPVPGVAPEPPQGSQLCETSISICASLPWKASSRPISRS